jgi:hypothetical protein
MARSINYQYLINHAAAARAEHLRAPVPFCAPLRLVPFTTSPVIDDLIARVDAKRDLINSRIRSRTPFQLERSRVHRGG